MLFYGHAVGWTGGAYGFAVLLAMALINRDLLGCARAWRILALGLGLCLALVEEPSALALAVLVVLAISFAACGEASVFDHALRWLQGLLLTGSQAIRRAFADLGALLTIPTQSREQTRLVGALKAWLLPIGGAAIFTALFAAANPVFDGWLVGIDLNAIVRLMPDAERVAFWGMSAAVIWVILRARLANVAGGRRSLVETFTAGVAPLQAETGRSPDVLAFLFSDAAIVRSMVVFNVMFAAQNAMDGAYLWGGKSLPAGFSFASYAHRGAYPLIVTAVLAAAFVLIAFRRSGEPSTSGQTEMGLARRLMFLWVGQNVLLVLSSIWRMVLYVEAYSLTYTRVAVMIWMGLVALGLVLIVIRFVGERGNLWLVNANSVALGTVLYVSSFVNFGGLIADYNVRHCRELTGHGVLLDIGYIGSIGPSAVPALRRYVKAIDPDPNWRAVRARSLLQAGEEQLVRRQSDWRGWTWRLHRIAGAS